MTDASETPCLAEPASDWDVRGLDAVRPRGTAEITSHNVYGRSLRTLP